MFRINDGGNGSNVISNGEAYSVIIDNDNNWLKAGLWCAEVTVNNVTVVTVLKQVIDYER